MHVGCVHELDMFIKCLLVHLTFPIQGSHVLKFWGCPSHHNLGE